MYIYTEEYKRFKIEEILIKEFITESEFRFLKNMNERYPKLFEEYRFKKRGNEHVCE